MGSEEQTYKELLRYWQCSISLGRVMWFHVITIVGYYYLTYTIFYILFYMYAIFHNKKNLKINSSKQIKSIYP